MLFPAPLEDETLYSLIARLMSLNGRSPQTIFHKTNRYAPDRAADLIIAPDWLFALSNDIYGLWPEIISKYHHSPHYLQEEVSSIELIALSNFNRNIWRWCEECMYEQIEKIGISYWQKHFQRECVLACTAHKSALQEINLPFRERQSRFLLPAHVQLMPHKAACRDEHLEMALNISKIQERLSTERFIGHIPTLKHLFEANRRNSTWETLMNHCLDMLSDSNQRSFSFMKSLLSAYEPPSRYLSVLVYTTCGSYEFFKRQYEWAIAYLSIGTTLVKENGKKNHRDLCSRHIKDNPKATRTDIWHSLPQTAKWLHKYDNRWFNQCLLSEKKSVVYQLKLFND